jgi:outer membrane lipoprotein carrier protein
MKRALAFAVLTLVAAAPLRAQTSLLDRAAAKYKKTNTLRAEFRQTLSNPLTGSTNVTHGVLLRRAPNLLSVTFDGAVGDRIMADGSALWIYSPSSAPGQVIKIPASGRSRINSIDPGDQFLVAPATKYAIVNDGAAKIAGHATQVFILTPKQPIPGFTKARVWIDSDDATVRQFETTDANGLRRVVEIESWRPNVSIPRSAFRFTPPAGVRIVDQSAFTGAQR